MGEIMMTFEEIKISDWITAGASIVSAIIAGMTFFLYRKSELEKRPKLSISQEYPEITLGYDDAIFSEEVQVAYLRTVIKIWNDGFVPTGIKSIEISDCEGNAIANEIHRGVSTHQLEDFTLNPGEVVTKVIKVYIGRPIRQIDFTFQPQGAGSWIAEYFTEDVIRQFSQISLVISPTNLDRFVFPLRNHFFGCAKATPKFESILLEANRSAMEKIVMKIKSINIFS